MKLDLFSLMMDREERTSGYPNWYFVMVRAYAGEQPKRYAFDDELFWHWSNGPGASLFEEE